MHAVHIRAAPDQRPSRLGGRDELAWSLRLLATTGIHVSLVRVEPQGDPAVALDAARRAFGSDGVYGVLDDGAAVVLLVDTPADQGRAEDLVMGRLRGAGAPDRLGVSTYHAFADQVADADDALHSLALMPKRRLSGG